MKAAPNFEPTLLWCRPHPSLQAKSSCSTHHLMAIDVITLFKCPIYHQIMTKNRTHLSLRSRLSGLPSRRVETCDVLRRSFVLENESLWPLGPSNLVCAHGKTILTNCELSKLIGESVYFMPSRLGHGLLYSRKIWLGI